MYSKTSTKTIPVSRKAVTLQWAVARWVRQSIFNNRAKHLDSFGNVLLLTLFSVGLLMVFDIGDNHNDTANAVVSSVAIASLALTLLYSLRASGVVWQIRRMVTIGLLIGLAATAVVIVTHAFYPERVAITRIGDINIFWTLIAFITPLATTHRLLSHPKVTLETLFASLAAYLQIALAFGLLYIYLASSAGLHIFNTVTSTTAYMYYSMTTITTLGIGDLYAVGRVGRILTVFEAAAGQIYLVVLVTMNVSLYVNTRNIKE